MGKRQLSRRRPSSKDRRLFGVSIDYLYGRAKEDTSTVQKIIDELQNIVTDSDSSKEEFFEQALNYAWAIQLAAWASTRSYYDRPELDEKDTVTVSEISSKAGFTYMRLNKTWNIISLLSSRRRALQII